jgi:siroheme synthase-like protein
MPYFPLFINLKNRPCVVIGGGAVAARKVRSLIDFGALVTVLAPEPSGDIRSLAEKGFLTLAERAYKGPEDLAGAVLLIAAADKSAVNAEAAKDAAALGIPVNAADDPEKCTFFFPALVRRGELTAGISSSGACPRLTAKLREQLEALWPPGFGEALEYLKEERRRLKHAGSAERIRRLDSLIARLLAEGNLNQGRDEIPADKAKKETQEKP